MSLPNSNYNLNNMANEHVEYDDDKEEEELRVIVVEDPVMQKILEERSRCLQCTTQDEETASAKEEGSSLAELTATGTETLSSENEATKNEIENEIIMADDTDNLSSAQTAPPARPPVTDKVVAPPKLSTAFAANFKQVPVLAVGVHADHSPMLLSQKDGSSEAKGNKNRHEAVVPVEETQPGAFAVGPGTPVSNNPPTGVAEEGVQQPFSRRRDGETTTESTERYESQANTTTITAGTVPLRAFLVSNSNHSNRRRNGDVQAEISTGVATLSDVSLSRGNDEADADAVDTDIETASGDNIVVKAGPTEHEGHTKNRCFIGDAALKGALTLLVITLILMILGLSGILSSSQSGSDDGHNEVNHFRETVPVPSVSTVVSPTLERIKERGVLRCFQNWPLNAPITLLDDALCNAVAAALSVKAIFTHSSKTNIFSDLQQDNLDIITSVMTHTMASEVYETSGNINAGFAYTIPYLYGGIRVGGDPFFVDCAEDNFNHLGECSDLMVCVYNLTTDIDVIGHYLPERHFKVYNTDELRAGTLGKYCNVMAYIGFCPAEQLLREYSKIQNIKLGTHRYSKNPLSVVTRGKDPLFSDFVNSVIQVLLAAETYGITQEKADSIPQTDLFGPEYRDMFRKAVQFGGNFDEIFNRTMTIFSPLDGMNRINEGATGLLYSHPFGPIENNRDAALLGPILQGILTREKLRCGVLSHRLGFAMRQDTMSGIVSYTGMDVDYCRALAAGLYQGDTTAVDFVELEEATDGYQLLARGEIDVFAGAEWTLQNDIREPTTGLGFAFSQPYFYSYGTGQENLCIATRQDDHTWSSFVSWIVAATIHAEANGITKRTSNTMPEVFVFGTRFKRMFRDAILSFGSYADMYAENVEPYVARGGRNMLNANPESYPQYYIPPGIF